MALGFLQHRLGVANAMIDDPKVVSLRESMLVNEVEASLSRRGALPLAVFNEAGIRLLTFVLKLLAKRIMMFVYMKGEKVGRGEILATGCTAIAMFLCVMDLESFNGRKVKGIAMRR